MVVDLELVEIARQSYKRCYQDEGFFKLFYDDFLQQSDEIVELFANTDWHMQKHLIASAIRSAIMFAGSSDLSAAKEHIEALGHSHSESQMNIKPEFYPIWLESMMRTVKKTDPFFSPQVDKAWREVLMFTINLMVSKYD